jgi:hypothetical protein
MRGKGHSNDAIVTAKPTAITVDNGTEFVSKAMDAWGTGTTCGSIFRCGITESTLVVARSTEAAGQSRQGPEEAWRRS